MEQKSNGALRAREGTQSVGVVDALGIGFEKVNGVLWVLLFPVLLGLFLWQGLQLSAAPAIDKLLTIYLSSVPPEAVDAAVGSSALPPDVSTLDQLRGMLQMLGGDWNLFSFLTVGVGLAGRGAVPALPFGDGRAMPLLGPIASPVQALAVVALLYLLGLFLGGCFLGCLAQAVRGERPSLSRLLSRAGRSWLSMVAFLAAFLVAMFGVSVPTALLLVATLVFSPAAVETISSLVLILWQTAALWLMVFGFFFVDAVVVSELGPLQAFRSSVRLVSRNFWSAISFVALYLLISYGMLVVWMWLGGEPWGIVLAIVGNAYVASGLAAGSMVYYRTHVGNREQGPG